MESLELLANNVADASTGGYKADREFYNLYVAPEAGSAGSEDAPAAMPLIEKPWIDMSQGLVHTTGNPLDLALSGKGFFTVAGSGGPLYTRNGSFHLAADGRLVTTDGYPVRSTTGNDLVLRGSRSVDIASDGTVRQDGQVVGKLEVADFTSTAGLVKQGSNYFRVTDPAARPVPVSATAVEQGKLEAANTGSAESAIRLVNVLRQFEMLQKAVSLGSEMNRQAIEQVARVGS